MLRPNEMVLVIEVEGEEPVVYLVGNKQQAISLLRAWVEQVEARDRGLLITSEHGSETELRQKITNYFQEHPFEYATLYTGVAGQCQLEPHGLDWLFASEPCAIRG